jgi:hypothetical protein
VKSCTQDGKKFTVVYQKGKEEKKWVFRMGSEEMAREWVGRINGVRKEAGSDAVVG